MSARLSHNESLEVIWRASRNVSDISDRWPEDELPAVISHWMRWRTHENNPVPADICTIWEGLLSDEAVLPRDNPGKTFLAPRFRKQQQVKITYSGVPFDSNQTGRRPKFTFVDLYAGVGGFRIALERLGGRCIFSSEWDLKARHTYLENFGDVPFGDIAHFTDDSSHPGLTPLLPAHDILVAGFPCQPFSQAGRKKGFEDVRGTEFFNVLNIAHRLQPRVLLLENVKHFRSHDRGNTHRVVLRHLRDSGYKVYSSVLRAYDYGVAQNRERTFIVAFKDALHYDDPGVVSTEKRLHHCIADALEQEPDPRVYLSAKIWDGHLKRKEHHRARGYGFGFTLYKGDEPFCNTISARYYKDGSEVLVRRSNGETPRMLTPRECFNLQGFPEEFIPHASRKEAWQQAGNAVAVPVAEAVGRSIIKALADEKPVRTSQPGLPMGHSQGSDLLEPVIR